ncbi:hypothetical protein LguiA_003408 [Lonicera macranthoides]
MPKEVADLRRLCRYTALPLSAAPINDHHTSQPIHGSPTQPIHGSSTAIDDHCRSPSATPLVQHQSLHKTVYQCPEIPWEPNNVDPSSQHHTTELSHRLVATMDIDLRDLLELGSIDLSVLYLQSAHRSEDIWAREEWHTTILLRTRRCDSELRREKKQVSPHMDPLHDPHR